MQIQAINCCQPKPHFTSRRNGYENPISRSTERNLAIWTSVGASSLVGLSAAGIGSWFIKSGSAKRAPKLAGIGIAAGLATMVLTLPSKLYNTKVNAFTREKEMDVFSRDRDLKSNIMEEVNEEVKDEDVSLDEKINHYATVQMANNGKGLMVKGV